MSTKHKLNIEYIIQDLEELLNKTDEHRSDDLSAIKRTIDLLNRGAVMRIGGKSVVILSDDEIEIEQSNTKDSTVFMEDHGEGEEGNTFPRDRLLTTLK
ncbi:hypothetical protein HUG15_20320 [Salicibibacter cibarius]|uniref:Uncharacterized protein n=1 Tax=Salicibibacter cibarius TaxID=2743000 RepID=A0A7T6Z6D3_9BACI|nr:hypothetical protein [Salicibibacter cibarius]QQK77695.1 hypothetical protein HUG15_20320 [Salicibibacter cibarius]